MTSTWYFNLESLVFGTFQSLGLTRFNILRVCLYIFAVTVSLVFCRVLYKIVRCKFGITVNCWFCNTNTKVPFNDANCWDCPNCLQYNGFTKDGGYNKEITEQHQPTLQKVFASVKSALTPAPPSLSANGFCRLCNINQQLKVQQLALFVPIDEASYDVEIERFREQLEKSYRLCARCEATLEKTLDRQNYTILKDRLSSPPLTLQTGVLTEGRSLAGGRGRSLAGGRGMDLEAVCRGGVHSLRAVSFALCLAAVLGVFPQRYIPDMLTTHSEFLGERLKLLAALGFILHSLTAFLSKQTSDQACLVSWALLQPLCWVPQGLLHAPLTLLCVLPHLRALYTSPRLPRLRKHPLPPISSPPQPPSPKPKKKRLKKKPRKPDADLFQSCLEETPRKQSSLFEALPEINPHEKIRNDLHSLHLGHSDTPKTRNFLFENHNFVDRVRKDGSSIIKPAKFFGGPVINWNCSDADAPSRSSTPSSGYSSQKIEPRFKPTPPKLDFYDPYAYYPMQYSYPCSPPGFPFYPRFSPISDVSTQGSNFQTSPGVKTESKWGKFTAVVYSTSVFLNLLTVSFFLYSLYAGIISIDWKLPQFGFHI